MDMKLRLRHNKYNNQLSIDLPRKKFPELRGREKVNPKFIKIKGFEFLE